MLRAHSEVTQPRRTWSPFVAPPPSVSPSRSVSLFRSVTPSRFVSPSPGLHDSAGGMASPAQTDEINEVIKKNDSEAGGEPTSMEEPAQGQTPAHFPLSTQEQLQAMARRREAAVSFKHQINECRLALKYSVIGWTGTLDPEKIPAALSNAPSIHILEIDMDMLERKLAPFLPPADNNNTNANNSSSNAQGLGPDALASVERVRAMLLEIAPGIKSTRHIRPVLDTIEQSARAAGILPPRDNVGWVWSLSFDDWFIWDVAERTFVSARCGVRTDFVAA